MTHPPIDESADGVAIIGMAGRFPGARTIEEFWQNVRSGVESISFFTEDELLAAGTDPALLKSPKYIRAKGVLADVELFDASFFGYPPQEARLMDPQHRIFLECAWHALENAGYHADAYPGAIGVFAGANFNQYLVRHLLATPGSGPAIAFDKDYLATRVSYKLNLKGPSLAIQTACSTSLVAVAQACQSILSYQCDMALAGGISVHLPHKAGYVHHDGGILSPDGHCRPFDAAARGTVLGSGAGIVVLKRLADAVADGDRIRAVIRGFAVNNDGSSKMGYMAPSIEGQAQAIAMAQALAGIDAGSVGYIEAHGTGTELGDPIEIAALTQAFRVTTDAKQFCAVGSVKSNIGHLDSAAGVAGLIKTVLALEHRELPPSLHFERPNPKIDFGASPFFVNATLAPWRAGALPRRAGVSSFGIGGTNAHLVLEEAPPSEPSAPSRPWQLVLVSARSASALEEATANLARFLEQHSETSLADAAYTLQVGRKPFACRRALVARDAGDAVRALRANDRTRVAQAVYDGGVQPLVFEFAPEGEVRPDDAGALYQSEPVFRAAVDRCLDALERDRAFGLRRMFDVRATTSGDGSDPTDEVRDAALFVFEYAIAELLSSWRIEPAGLTGAGIGELAAACVSGVLGLRDALELLARRAAATTAPALSGLAVVEERWAAALVRERLSSPRIPYISGRTGSTITDPVIADRSYWSRLLRPSGVQPNDLDHTAALPTATILRIGPGESLGGVLPREASAVEGVPTGGDSAQRMARAVGDLWLRGIEPDWKAYHGGERRLRIELPPYPFERKRYWIERPAAAVSAPPAVNSGEARRVEDWFYAPSWRRATASHEQPVRAGRVLLFMDDAGLGARLATRLAAQGNEVVSVRAGALRERLAEDLFIIDPAAREDYHALAAALASANWLPDTIVHLWGAEADTDSAGAGLSRELALGFYSVLYLVQAFGEPTQGRACRLQVVTTRAARVLSDDVTNPGRAAVTGLCRVVPHEYTQLSCRTIDLVAAEWAAASDDELDQLVAEFRAADAEPAAAFRGRDRWVQTFDPAPRVPSAPRLKAHGTYLITGGLGAVGLTLAGYLASTVQANLVLVGRHGLPPRESWGEQRSPEHTSVVAHRIRAVEALERTGAEVLVAAADVADEAQMRAVVDEAFARFGAIDGVIHAAGVMARSAFKTIGELDWATCAEHFRPKIDGVVVLDRIFHDRPLDFCLLTSSLSAVLGGLSLGAYASANAFMDAFAAVRSADRWTSVNWDGWQFGAASPSGTAPGALPAWIAADDGIEVFRLLLSSAPVPQVLVSTSDLSSRVNRWVEMRGIQDHAPDASADMPLHPRPRLQTEYVPPQTDLERAVGAAWRDVLGVDPIGIDDNFFELGGDSFRGLQLIAIINKRLAAGISPVSLYEGPTVRALAGILGADPVAQPAAGADRSRTRSRPVAQPARSSRGSREAEALPAEGAVVSGLERGGAGHTHDDVAIIGIAGRFPGASTIDRFWENLRNGVEARTLFSDEELKAAGIGARLRALPKFVNSGFPLDGVDQFDAEFFGINPREAELLDPQQRLFLECAWEALENAGYDAQTYRGAIGVFGGSTPSSYLTNNVLRSAKTLRAAGGRQSALGNVGDYMVTRVAYKLNLKGPSCLVQTACSTSLVAVHLGCQSLQLGESDMVLAGGVSIMVPQRTGYVYEEGGMLSPDGVCRAFDANARGTAFGSGVGIVVLKRLREALRDGDHVYAVIKGGATNNDGSLKVGFTAPSIAGQADVIAEAMARASVSPETVSYVEAHGTGTELGDPIEVAALTRAYRAGTDRTGFCALGSVKPNIGHLDAAAGVSSLIKTVLALAHRELPPTINFERPNPKIEFEGTPFFVNTTLQPWPVTAGPRRAGVSSFGFGGTNAHLVLEEAPVAEPAEPGRSEHLLVLSARSASALDAAASRLADELRRRPDVSLADVAYTLQVGRRPFAHRRAIVCGTHAEALEALDGRDGRRTFTGRVAAKDRRAIFLFPGQGAQYVNMGLDLYNEEPVFQATVDECAERLLPDLGFDLRDALYPPAGDGAAAAARLTQTVVAQAALFTTEFALARLWMGWGVCPSACLGHSIGELVAACVSGVLELPDALRLVALRGRLMSQMPDGVMVAVPLAEERINALLDGELWLSAVNGPSLCVVSGRRNRIEAFVARLAQDGIECHRLHTSHAFHSGLMEGAVDAFVRGFAGATLRAPRIPFVSNVTGDWITEGLATDPAYWGRHIRQPVRFSQGVRTLLAEPDLLFLEAGPGNTLGALVRQHTGGQGGHVVVSSMRHPQESSSDVATVFGALGRLWIGGAAVDWSRLHAGARRRRVPLPAYPFERQRYWVEPDTASPAEARRSLGLVAHDDLAEWFHVPSWKRTALRTAPAADVRPAGWALLFVDARGVGSRVAERFATLGRETVVVEHGEAFARAGARRYVINPHARADYVALLRELRSADRFPATVGHFWGVTGPAGGSRDDGFARRCEDLGFYSLLYLSQAIGEVAPNRSIDIGVVTDGVHEVVGNEPLVPEKATVLGPCHVIPQEFAQLGCRNIDLAIDGADASDAEVSVLVTELLGPAPESIVAFRHGRRWAMTFEPLRLEAAARELPSGLRSRGVYLITGGTGGIGLVLAQYLAKTAQARLILTSRRGLPPRDAWADYHSRDSDDRTASQIAAVRELEAAGAEVVVAAADVADEPAMRRVVEDAVARFGRIDGVIHAAGVAGGGMIQLKTRETAADVLRPKVDGTRVLARVLENQEPDFLVLCSSLTSVVGGVGQIDYCAANAYLDAFARHYRRTSGQRAIAVNWTTWRDVGMAVETNVPESLRPALKGQALAAGLGNEEGVDAFCRVLAPHDESQIAVSSRDVGFLLEAARAARPAANGHGARPVAADRPDSSHPRPNVQSPFVAPRSGVEERICAIWRDNLGIDRVGVDDNFFELGGHSLLAVRVMARVNEELGTEISIAKLYEGLTVRFLADQVGRGDRPEMEAEADAHVAERRRDKTRRQKDHQQRRRALMRR